jgi:hypothetical protein
MYKKHGIKQLKLGTHENELNLGAIMENEWVILIKYGVNNIVQSVCGFSSFANALLASYEIHKSGNFEVIIFKTKGEAEENRDKTTCPSCLGTHLLVRTQEVDVGPTELLYQIVCGNQECPDSIEGPFICKSEDDASRLFFSLE